MGMMKTLFLTIGLFAGYIAAAPTQDKRELVETDSEAAKRGRSLFPIYAIRTKCARYCSALDDVYKPMMSVSDANVVKGGSPVNALEMLALNDDLNTMVESDDKCTRRHAMARAAGLAAGLALSAVNKPGFAAETKMVKMGSDSGQLVFVPDEVTLCKVTLLHGSTTRAAHTTSFSMRTPSRKVCRRSQFRWMTSLEMRVQHTPRSSTSRAATRTIVSPTVAQA